MKILVVNDDGINAPGIIKLAAMAKSFGDVTVVAPMKQCSGMSLKITLGEKMELRRAENFPVSGVDAWCLSGTPTDCIKAALYYCMNERPNWVFSGINDGFNTGFDIAYSGTMGAAAEAVMRGIPAIAFSTGVGARFNDAEKYIPRIAAQFLDGSVTVPPGCVVNVNFPGCSAEDIKEIRMDTLAAKVPVYRDNYHFTESNGELYMIPDASLINPEDALEGTDVWCVMHERISVGFIKTMA